MKKIYNKKSFISGIIYLLLVIVTSIIGILKGYHYTNHIHMIKGIVIDVLLLLIGINSIYRSLNPKFSREDMKNDKSEKLINLKTSHTSLSISTKFCFVLLIILIITFSITQYNSLIIAILCVAAILNVLLICPIIVYYYYNKHN